MKVNTPFSLKEQEHRRYLNGLSPKMSRVRFIGVQEESLMTSHLGHLSNIHTILMSSLLTFQRFETKMSFFMSLKMTFLGACIRAFLTFERFETKMSVFMSLKVTFISACIRAFLTFERCETKMIFFMCAKSTFSGACIRAL